MFKAMKKNNEIEGIIFDLGGVVIESFEFGFYEDMGRKFGVSSKDVERAANEKWTLLERGKETNEELWHNVARELKLDISAGETLASMWLESYRRDALIKEDVLAIVKKLRDTYKLGVISNSQKEHSVINRERGLFAHFDVVVLSDEVGMSKPQRGIFELASERMGIPFQNLLFIDNDPRWVAVARKYGLCAVLFTSANQLKKSLIMAGVHI